MLEGVEYFFQTFIFLRVDNFTFDTLCHLFIVKCLHFLLVE